MPKDTERLENIIFLHIFLFLMSYDSSNASIGDIKTIALYNQWDLSYHIVSYNPEKLITTYLWVNLIFNLINHLIVCILASSLNPEGFFDR